MAACRLSVVFSGAVRLFGISHLSSSIIYSSPDISVYGILFTGSMGPTTAPGWLGSEEVSSLEKIFCLSSASEQDCKKRPIHMRESILAIKKDLVFIG